MTVHACSTEGCYRTAFDGGIYRTSPKGEPFEGKCAEHYPGPIDPLVRDVVDAVRGVLRGAE